jgi:peptidoglycan endopeptidase LytE
MPQYIVGLGGTCQAAVAQIRRKQAIAGALRAVVSGRAADSQHMQWRAPAVASGVLGLSISAACASSGVAPKPFPVPPAAAGRPATPAPLPAMTPASQDGFAIARTALSLRGVPYRLGGADTRGFDCSGLVQYVFALHGLGMPRVVRDQVRLGQPVALDALEPGDLIFFDTDGDAVSHVGIVIGGDQFVHAPNSRGVVRVNRLTSGYWAERAVAARRLSASPTDTQ